MSYIPSKPLDDIEEDSSSAPSSKRDELERKINEDKINRERRREMKNEKTKKRRARNTFVATVRISMTDIAAIGMVVEKDNNYKETLGRLASEGLRIMGSIAKRIYPIDTFEKAIKELRRMGYNDPLEKGTRYYDAIYKELGIERTEAERKKSAQSETNELVKQYNEQTAHRPAAEEQEEILNRHMETEQAQSGQNEPIEPLEQEQTDAHEDNWGSGAREQQDMQKIKKGFAGAPPVTS